MSGWLVANNTFKNVSFAFQLGGGRENHFINNTINDAPRCGISFDDRGLNWDKRGCVPGGIPYDFLDRVPYNTSAVWLERYGPYLRNITVDDACRPKYNVIEGNTYCNLKTFITASAADIQSWGSIATDNTEKPSC